MGAAMTCSGSVRDHQPFPRAGRLADNANLALDALRDKISAGRATVYCYVVASIENRGGHFVQRGSGPNFQGDLMTLCTCKHRMRTFRSIDAWKDQWIAGFTGARAGSGQNCLVYLMRVSQAFESHHGLWFAETVSFKAKQAKSAHLTEFGDIFRPRSESGDPFDPHAYIPPCSDHVHRPNDRWHRDINYRGCSQRSAALLVGDSGHSYLWDRPTIAYPTSLHRGQAKWDLDDLLTQLEAIEYRRVE